MGSLVNHIFFQPSRYYCGHEIQWVSWIQIFLYSAKKVLHENQWIPISDIFNPFFFQIINFFIACLNFSFFPYLYYSVEYFLYESLVSKIRKSCPCMFCMKNHCISWINIANHAFYSVIGLVLVIYYIQSSHILHKINHCISYIDTLITSIFKRVFLLLVFHVRATIFSKKFNVHILKMLWTSFHFMVLRC